MFGCEGEDCLSCLHRFRTPDFPRGAYGRSTFGVDRSAGADALRVHEYRNVEGE
jgi:hypothetical protein